MSKKTIITILGALVSVIPFLPLPFVILKLILFILGLLIIFFTRAKVSASPKVLETKSSRKI